MEVKVERQFETKPYAWIFRHGDRVVLHLWASKLEYEIYNYEEHHKIIITYIINSRFRGHLGTFYVYEINAKGYIQ